MTTQPAPQGRQNERGNVLFLILIAVALFAALSYAVTQSSRSGGGDAGKETNLVNSAQITQYPSGIRTAIVRMIIGGTDVTTLKFNPPSTFSALTTLTEGVFHPNGGGATYSLAPPDVVTTSSIGEWTFNGENQIVNIGTTAATMTAAEADLIAFLPDVSNSVCSKLNESLGLPTTAPEVTGIDFTTQMDTTTPGFCNGGCGGTIGSTGGADVLNGKPFGCFRNGAAGEYVYYHVLVER
ncbi:MAG TPA: hypothetical protein VGD95_06335 [Micavibrio sp.]